MEEGNRPLVSICVITYNSAQFVVETLESAKNQTYSNIELIISDDCSKDNTVEICSKWLEQNEKRFVRAKLLTYPFNTGIVSNANRAIHESSGEWIKLIAGDDLFLPDAIESYVQFVKTDSEIQCCFARTISFCGTIPQDTYKKESLFLENLMYGKTSTAKRQFNILKHTFAGSGNTVFFKKKLFDEIGAFDERFPLQEDHAFFIKVTKAGYKFHLLDANTVFYRLNPNSVCHSGSEGKIFTPQEVRYIQEYKYAYMTENLSIFGRVAMKCSLFMRNSIIKSGNSKNNLKSRLLFVIYALIDPFVNYNRVMSIIDKYVKK